MPALRGSSDGQSHTQTNSNLAHQKPLATPGPAHGTSLEPALGRCFLLSRQPRSELSSSLLIIDKTSLVRLFAVGQLPKHMHPRNCQPGLCTASWDIARYLLRKLTPYIAPSPSHTKIHSARQQPAPDCEGGLGPSGDYTLPVRYPTCPSPVRTRRAYQASTTPQQRVVCPMMHDGPVCVTDTLLLATRVSCVPVLSPQTTPPMPENLRGVSAWWARSRMRYRSSRQTTAARPSGPIG